MLDKSKSDEVYIMDYLIVLLKKKRLIFVITCAFAVISAAVVLLMPPRYKAETRILSYSSGKQSFSGQLMGQAGIQLGAMAPFVAGLSQNDVYVGMLKSRSVADRIIDRFGLIESYGIDYREDARERLDKRLEVKNGKDGIIVISFADKDPFAAANIANAYVDELKTISTELALSEASQRRLFFEVKLSEAKDVLSGAEDGMKLFQENTGAIQMESQTKAAIEGIARLRAQIAAKEVEIRVMKTYTTAINPDMQKADEELKGLNGELRKLESRSGTEPDPLMSTGRMPGISTEYLRRLRDLKYYETLYDLMTRQYETARIDEARDFTAVQVIDKAMPPEKKSGRGLLLVVSLASVGGFFISLITAFLTDHVECSMKTEGGQRRLCAIKSHLPFSGGRHTDFAHQKEV